MLQGSECSGICSVRIPSGPSGQLPLSQKGVFWALPRRWFRPPGLAVCCAGPLPGRRIGAGWTGPAPEEPRP